MCLKYTKIRELEKPKDWVTGYKVLKKTWNGTLMRSWYANQEWKFAELVKAQKPEEVEFLGSRSPRYEEGIHAWKTFKEALTEIRWLENDSITVIVKVLLFKVTHSDVDTYRADYGIVIDTLNKSKKRIPWPGG